MLSRKLADCDECIAGDGTCLCELLHPDKQPLALRYSLAQVVLPAGQTSTPHALTTSEVHYILSGRGEMHLNDEVELVEPGDALYIPPKARQFLDNSGEEPLVFLCLVDPAWRWEDETVFAAD